MSSKASKVINRICYMVLIPFVSIIHVMLNRYRTDVHNIKTLIDELIPFNKFFIIPYVYWFAYIFVVLTFFAVVDYRYYFRLLMSIIAGMFVCFIVYYFFPTTVPRPEVFGNDMLSRLVRFVYSKDNPYNCFPSIHVLNALLVTLFFCDYYKGRILRALSIISCVLISLSTLFVKQHYVLDVVSSALLGSCMYLMFTNDYLWSRVPVKRIIDFLVPSKARDINGV